MLVREEEKVIKRKVYVADEELEVLSEMDNFLDELESCYDDVDNEIICQLVDDEDKDIGNSIFTALTQLRNMIDNILILK